MTACASSIFLTLDSAVTLRLLLPLCLLTSPAAGPSTTLIADHTIVGHRLCDGPERAPTTSPRPLRQDNCIFSSSSLAIRAPTCERTRLSLLHAYFALTALLLYIVLDACILDSSSFRWGRGPAALQGGSGPTFFRIEHFRPAVGSGWRAVPSTDVTRDASTIVARTLSRLRIFSSSLVLPDARQSLG